MRIVLIYPWYDTYLWIPPLGIGYISSYLKKYGQEVYIIEGCRDNLSPTQILEKVKEINPDVVGISCLSPFFENAKKVAKLIKAENYKLVMGGVHPTFMPYTTLKETGADLVICGEGEIPWRELVLSNFENPTSIKGVYDINSFNEDPDKPILADIVENLDEIPFPDWDELKFEKYNKYATFGQFAKDFPVATILMSRGCNHACTFCANPDFYQHKIRYRSVENVIAELEYLKKRYGVKEFHLCDNNLIYDKNYTKEFCKALKERNINLPWTCPNGVRADCLDYETAKLLKNAGCYFIAIGIESANPQILKNIRKGETIEQITKAIEIAHSVGLEVQGQFILGLPGETKETMQQTLDYIISSKIERALINILQFFPGSQVWKDMRGEFKEGYEDATANLCTYASNDLTVEEIQKALPKAILRFWLQPRVIWHTLKYIKIEQIPMIIKRLIMYNVFSKAANKIFKKEK